MSVYVKNGKVVTVDGKVAVDASCCCINGACCSEDGSCSVKTESKCISDGGTYQGDETVCDPNPCETLPPCNDCGGFNAFDGSGRKFLTRTTRYVDSGINDGTPRNANFDTDATEIASYDPLDCSLSFIRSGNSSGSDTINSCNRDLVDSAGGNTFGGPLNGNLAEQFVQSNFQTNTTPCHWVIVCEPWLGLDSDTHTATTHDVAYSCTNAHSSATASWHVELSDECIPDGFLPAP